MELFGAGRAVLAERLTATVGTDVPLLGQIPLDILLREGGDAGGPPCLAARKPRRPSLCRTSPGNSPRSPAG